MKTLRETTKPPARHGIPRAQMMALGFFLVLLPGLLPAQNTADTSFVVYATARQTVIELPEIVAQVAEADVLFFGEDHENLVGHQIQDRLYGLLLKEFGDVTLSLEMFETDCQLVLDEYLAGHITESKFRAAARPWPNYAEAYRPLVEQAKEANQTVIAANAPRRYVNLVSRKGIGALDQLPKDSRRHLAPLPIEMGDGGYLERFETAMGGIHIGMGSEMFEAQCTWDATMAHRIVQGWKQDKKRLIFHLAGRFHTDYQSGTVAQVKRLRKGLNVMNISAFPVDDLDNIDFEQYAGQADFVIFLKQDPED